LQHDNYISIYRGISKMLRSIGDHVQAGESIALLQETTLHFELWQNGHPINPEEVIPF
jgi:septal ring factor EnvC (AmiA/AmiB activator)